MYVPWWSTIILLAVLFFIIIGIQDSYVERIRQAKDALEEMRDKLEEEGINQDTSQEIMDALEAVIDRLDS